MTGTMTAALDEARQRLAARLDTRGLACPALTFPDALALVSGGLPDWWHAGGNRLFAMPGTAPGIANPPGHAPCTNALVVLGSAATPGLLVWGDAPLVVLGAGTGLSSTWVACGDGATVAIGDRTACTNAGRVDARNGGMVVVGEDGLWATGVMLNSDHMHAIRDLSGRRLNPFGGTVEIARHVWLGHEAMLMPGARIGADTVIGARSIVSRPLPANTVCAGAPARVVREGATWAFEDLP